MITGLRVCSFKRFYDEDFAFAPLTVLTGLNGSGKTSVIHSLLLTWEAAVAPLHGAIRLNGPFGMELGAAEEVRNWRSDGQIEFHLSSEANGISSWKLGVPSSDSLYLTVEDQSDSILPAFGTMPRVFSYLCAERLGPRNVLGASPLPDEQLEVGVRGEHCAQILATLGNKPLEDESRLHPLRNDEAPSLLKYEVERWLGEIARPVELDAIRYPGSAITAMRFRFVGGQDWVRAPNMGFGVSYALPVILAGLTAQPGGILIVENPEAHLHPAGQSRMGVFLAWLAGRGVQVVVETHSDHVLNGIRRSIGEHGYLRSSDAVLHFFDSTENDEPRIQRLDFTSVGGVSHWPKGFFDQYQIDIASLGQVRRRG